MKLHQQTDLRSDEFGFGLIEIMVSMFLLALLAVFFLPTLIQSMQITVTNTTTATASQLVAAQLDQVRALTPDCDTVAAFDDVTPPATTDARGTIYQPHVTVGACPATFPGVVQVDVWVTEQGKPLDRLAEAVTLVYVGTQAVVTP
ncbi:prepilin-type N-terminal cleavage/methylation domain-containing protein [Cryobacterium sp. BB307]|uniref:prepilin-type N-terminal cleavage/methylation domain-containing protein n=1 Tax=Cryobacterium sp. BB307 TaxID=2716317 RepID=UPI0014466A6D